MTDPLSDPRFPDRPQHPHFWALSQIALRLDGDATEGGKTVPDMLDGVVDEDSLLYLMRSRTTLAVDRAMPGAPDQLKQMLLIIAQSVYLDAFLTGYDYRDQKS